MIVVVAMDSSRGIGRDGSIPWDLPGDRAFFRGLTTSLDPDRPNVLVMGRRTWESLPGRRPLRDRHHVVLSRRGLEVPVGVDVVGSLGAALELPRVVSACHVFAIGGEDVYTEALADPRCTTVYVTRVAGDFGCDRRMPTFEDLFELVEVVNRGQNGGVDYRSERWVRASSSGVDSSSGGVTPAST